MADRTTVRVVIVRSGDEVGRAVLNGGTVAYMGAAADVLRPQVRRRVDAGASESEAIADLAANGWSNGYLMVALGGEPAPE